MPFKKIYLLAVIIMLIIPVRVMAKTKISFHYELGQYNKSYEDIRFRDRERISFPVTMMNFGAEIHHTAANGKIVGCGVVETTLNGGEVRDDAYSIHEVQPQTLITMPYLFVGKAWDFWAFEVGISYYLTVAREDARTYLNADASTSVKDDSGMGLDRSGSHVFINGMIRVMPEDWLHFKFRLAREEFNITDTLLNLGIIYPTEKNIWELFVSFSFPAPEFLRANQRVGLRYSRKFDPLEIGLSTSILVNNERSGGGSVDFLHRWTIGAHVSLAW
ncbi:MAG: hypothetical protein GY754_36770 [bacterium]|nr:hypothetical protein [bacterium]